MFRPVETYEQLALLLEVDSQERLDALKRLNEILRHPADETAVSPVTGELPVFAHTGFIVRVVPKECEDSNSVSHYALQTWSPFNNCWETHRSYSLDDEAAAIEDARTWYPVPDDKAIRSWLPYVNGDQSFESRDQLAEFLYAVKPFANFQRPDMAFMREVAVTAIERSGIPRPELPAHEQERIVKIIEGMECEWFDPPPMLLRGLLRFPNAATGDVDVRFVQYPSVEEAAKELLAAPCVAVLRHGNGEDKDAFTFEGDMPREMLLTALQSFIDRQAPERTYTISVCAQHWDDEALEAGETNDREMVVERETVSPEELAAYARKFGIAVASASSPQHTENIWFSSSMPDESRAYFEQGVQTFYDLHVHAVDGREQLAAADFHELAKVLGVEFQGPDSRVAAEI